MAQKKRKTKTSRGEHGGGGKVQLSYLGKVLLGKGRIDSLEHVEVPVTYGRWYAGLQSRIEQRSAS